MTRSKSARAPLRVGMLATVLLITVSGHVAHAQVIDDFEGDDAPAPWSFHDGAEFPGATGGLVLGEGRTGQGAVLAFDFTDGGAYVAMTGSRGGECRRRRAGRGHLERRRRWRERCIDRRRKRQRR